jgi:hypothetical protein
MVITAQALFIILPHAQLPAVRYSNGNPHQAAGSVVVERSLVHNFYTNQTAWRENVADYGRKSGLSVPFSFYQEWELTIGQGAEYFLCGIRQTPSRRRGVN